MDVPIEVECRKCYRKFETRASTRTHCPYCRGAVTVRRDLVGYWGDSDYDAGRAPGWLGVILPAAVVLIGWWLGRHPGERAPLN